MDRFGALAGTVRDGDLFVLGGRVREDDDGSLYIDWAVNPHVGRLSAVIVGEVAELARDLRDNMWALALLRGQRRRAT